MIVPQTAAEVIARVSVAESRDRNRDSLAQLCREVFSMFKERKSTFKGQGSTEWRKKVADQYWQSDNRGFNAIDLATAILSGYSPAFRVTVPGIAGSKVTSRAEKFIGGVLRINSRRQQVDLVRDTVFRAALDGAVGLRVCWDASNPKPLSRVMDNIDGQDAMVSTYADRDFPIVVQTVPIDELHIISRGRYGKPFDEIVQLDMRTGDEVINEWYGVEGAEVAWIAEMPGRVRAEQRDRYIEWWGEVRESDQTTSVYHAVLWQNEWVVKPRRTTYPCIPYIVAGWKVVKDKELQLEHLPFLYAMINPSNGWEYLLSRTFRLVDMLSSLPPILERESGQPINISGAWGKVLGLSKGDKLYFPQYPGQPPDVYNLMAELRRQVDEATFSQAMFGQLSSKNASGYALGQQIGSDTIRLDNPRANLELAFATVADVIFQLMQAYAPQEYIAVTGTVKSKDLGAVLSGVETTAMVVECTIKPKMTQDELRRAAIGAQLASLPGKVISIYKILQDYFDVEQPEEEIDRVKAEEAENDPLIKLMAISEVLHKTGSPWASFIDQQLQGMLGKMGAPGMPGGAPQGGDVGGIPPQAPAGVDNLGMGVPQFTLGNAPTVPPSGNPQESADLMAMLGGAMPPDMGGMM